MIEGAGELRYLSKQQVFIFGYIEQIGINNCRIRIHNPKLVNKFSPEYLFAHCKTNPLDSFDSAQRATLAQNTSTH